MSLNQVNGMLMIGFGSFMFIFATYFPILILYCMIQIILGIVVIYLTNDVPKYKEILLAINFVSLFFAFGAYIGPILGFVELTDVYVPPEGHGQGGHH